MNSSNRIALLLLMLALLGGCTNLNSKKEVLAAGSQVEVRSYQTRTYDTNDKTRVLRAVMSTLQDLRFVIDKADDTVGIVSATKLDGYALSISVSVRPSGEQMIVRANAQYNLKAIEDPGPYQDFFAALDKGLFLDDNLLVDTVVAQAMATQKMAAQTDASTLSVYDFYGEAEAEINEASEDSDLWARALVEVEGDEQKRKARYIELRAEELYMQSPAALTPKNSSTSTPIAPVNTAASSSTPRELSSGGLTGIYTDDDGGLVNIQQSGNSIKGTYGKHGGTIDGTLNGETIEYKWEQRLKSNGRWISGSGRWRVTEGGTVLTGSWWDPGSSTRQGTWTLTKIETIQTRNQQAGLPVAMSSAANAKTMSDRGLSGTYLSEITTDTHWVFQKPSHRRIVLVFEQQGDTIVATSDSVNLKISGTRDGDRISFVTWPSDIGSSEIKGKWQVVDGGSRLEGKWTHPHGGGKWNLTRLR